MARIARLIQTFYNQFDDIFWRKRSGLSEKGKAELLTTTEPNKGKNLQKMLLDEWHLLFETVPNKQTNGFEGKDVKNLKMF